MTTSKLKRRFLIIYLAVFHCAAQGYIEGETPPRSKSTNVKYNYKNDNGFKACSVQAGVNSSSSNCTESPSKALDNWSCQGRCHSLMVPYTDSLASYVPCFCDPSCRLYGDCCHDYEVACTAPDMIATMRPPTGDGAGSGGTLVHFRKCVRIKEFGSRPVKLVTSCPRLSPKKSKQDCHVSDTSSMVSLIPVTSLDGHVFRNMHCAVCHGRKDFIFWNQVIECTVPPPIELITNPFPSREDVNMYFENHCTITQLHPNGFSTIELCTVEDKLVVNFLEHERYKSDISYDIQGTSFSVLLNFGFDGKTHILYRTENELRNALRARMCRQNEMYDPFKDACRDIICDIGYQPNYGSCIREDFVPGRSSSVYVSLLISVKYEFYEKLNRSLWRRIAIGAIRKHLKLPKRSLTLLRILNVSHWDQPMNINSDTDNRSNAHDVMDLTIGLKVSAVNDSHEKLNESFDALQENGSIEIRIGSYFILMRELQLHKDITPPWSNCKNGTERFYTSGEFEVRTVNTTSGKQQFITLSKTNQTFPEGGFELFAALQGSLRVIKGDLKNFSGVAFVCNHFPSESCAKVELHHSEYELLPDNRIRYHKFLLNPTDYVQIDNHTIEVCVHGEQDLKRPLCSFPGMDQAVRYSSVVLSVASLIAFTLTFITYVLLKELHNLPGICMMNLIMVLFLAELLFLLMSKFKGDAECQAVAVVLHFFFLTSFFWMNVMAIDVYRTFGFRPGMKRICSSDRWTYLPWYILYAYGVPAIIVGTCTFIEFSGTVDSSVARMGYGRPNDQLVNNLSVALNNTSSHLDNNTDARKELDSWMKMARQQSDWCWIVEPKAALASFGCPILIIFFINTILFVLTIHSIKKEAASTKKYVARKVSNTHHHMTGKNDVMVYVRMSTVMGFTWVFGFTSSIISGVVPSLNSSVCITLHTLNYMFDLLNASQGLFLFLAFVCNQRVLNLFRRFFFRLRQRERQVENDRIFRKSISVTTIRTSFSSTSVR